MKYPKLIVFVLLHLKSCLALQTPCPKYFVYEPDKSEEDRWYGIITLHSRIYTKGISVELHFDKSVIQFGNFFGTVTSNSDNTKFIIQNENKELQADVSVTEEIFVVYSPYDREDPKPPNIIKILLNGREICPNFQEQSIRDPNFNKPSITVNINVQTCGSTIVTGLPLITEGQHTLPGQWPWHVGIYRNTGGKREYYCGGSLISQQHVLTAAHCMVDAEGKPLAANEVLVILGKHGLFVMGSNEQRKRIAKVTVHENYNRTTFFNDISILELKTPIRMTTYVKPICLWEDDPDLSSVVDRVGTAVGWGRDSNNNALSDLLMQAQMPVVDPLTCIFANRDFYSQFTNAQNFCAGFRNGTSVCNGDSGGGLYFQKMNSSPTKPVWQLRGIVSNTVPKEGFICDPTYYVIFTDVAKYLNWIRQNMSD